MLDASGVRVGTVAIAGAAPARVEVTVEYAVPDGSYALVRRGAGDAESSFGTIEVFEGTGEWTGQADLPPDETVRVAMVDGRGDQVCEAKLS
jgi:hypothetical protein